ncbi:ABC transporter permease [Halomicroarcula limicola]|uniref:ABC transporter permease n=1 Tax=Haloarcula limicola TaxID=1429915 RepID=A0A8J8C3Q2_9EURY|nr:ABC transporter permease [Halomicroarcula limicola]MBV0923309.1 ABC transporter permease [Halomicroarcula limicola]
MSRLGRLRAESRAAARAFLRRRTAVFFTFFFPLIIVVIFGVLVQTRPGGGGLFTESPAYYVPGYLAVVVLFTPLSRVGSEVARHRAGNRFEKLATTPLTRPEWLLAQTLVNVVVIGLAGILLLALMVVLTGAQIELSPLLIPFVVLGVGLFCGVGAMLGSLADSQDGVISASNAIALPLLFLSETFVPPELLPGWFPTWLSPLTYFSRGVRAATTGEGGAITPLAVLTVCAVVGFLVGAWLLPQTD